ncbi:hypothetical protein GDO86_004418 [Hymenochirus boettgeri]|uniref:Uncharacterized protein n=1 Tax=Hymenochirus boettgeri TaxID=247094 RepID=A0A8T2K9S8_9PIPI|nr:hypothetical protein GDO86_004418 [Hymenochirus boettgeri]
MDPGHHTEFLLAILICVLLLLLILPFLLVCYCRVKCFKGNKWRMTRISQGLVKDQSTSMTGFTIPVTDSKSLVYHSHSISKDCCLIPSKMNQSCKHTSLLSSSLSVDQTLNTDEDFCSDNVDTVNTFAKDRQRLSTLSAFSNFLENSLFISRSKRCSSSLKSGLDPDILMAPLDSPAKETTLATGSFQAISIPIDLDQSSVLCDNSGQQFTWDTMGQSNLSNHPGHKESFSVPGTLDRISSVSKAKDSSEQDIVQLRKPTFPLQPKAWFVSIGNRPLSDGFQVVNLDLNTVTSLDSGVDIIEIPTKLEFKNNTIKDRKLDHVNQSPEEENIFHISHQEAAQKLNNGYNSRSLWQKREERPLIGAN